MGLMRLTIHDRDRIPPSGLGQVYMCGQDELPWYGRAYTSGNQLIIERVESDSGSAFVPWRIDGRGVLLLGTSTLMERERPYRLEVELARGTINRLRNQIASWEMIGLVVPADLRNEVLTATRHFARAATTEDPASAAEHAERALVAAADAMDHSASLYAEQAFENRRAQSRKLTTWFGVHLGDAMPAVGVARQLLPAFNMVSVPLSWRSIEASEGRRQWKQADAQIEWAKTAGMKIMGGPLLELDDRGVPDWTYLWEGDFDSLRRLHARPRDERREALSRKSQSLAGSIADEPRPRAGAHGGPAVADRGPGHHESPRARSVDAAHRVVRSTVGRVPGDASSSISHRSTLPTRWCGPTWACRGWGSKSRSATIRARRPIARRWPTAGWSTPGGCLNCR